MDRKTFLQELDRALTPCVPTRERAEMLRYYEEYFDEAGPEGEASVIESLGDPAELARKLAAEAGFGAVPEQPAPPKRHRLGFFTVIGILAVLLVAAVAIMYVVDTRDPYVPSEAPMSTQSVELVDCGQLAAATDENPLVVDSEGARAVYGRVFHTVEVEVPLADISIVQGENFGVELRWDSGSAYSLKCTVMGGVLKVDASRKGLGGLSVEGASAVILVPEGTELRDISVETGMGSIWLENINAREVDCETGQGDVSLLRVVSRQVDLATGMGTLRWGGPLMKDMELNNGMGDIFLTVDTLDGWDAELSTGMGTVMVNGEDKGTSFHQWGVSGELEVSAGMGDITLEYEN